MVSATPTTTSQRAPAGTVHEFAFASVSELHRLLRRREVSALELARSALAQLDGAGRRYRAVAELTADTAERDARAADAALRAGRGGPLCGIPYGAKDLLDTAGVPTRWGSPVYASRVPKGDATVIRRMRTAGAVLVAKLAMIELAGGGGYRTAGASATGACMNPWDSSRWTGGSSSGSAAAVAAGLIPISLGSETGGSLVLPAAFCGVTTIRPSFGVVSRHGAMPLAWSMDKIGPLAHTARDCALVLNAVAGHDSLDPTTDERALPRPRTRPMRLGIIRDATSTATASSFDDAVSVLRGLGIRIKLVALPEGDYLGTYFRVMAGEIADAHGDLIRSVQLDRIVDPAQREGLRRTHELPVIEFARAARTRVRLARDLRALFRDVDALIAPTILTEAAPLDADVIADRERRRGHAFLGAIAGLPAVSVPMGFGPSGLPLGLAFTGDLFSDATILRAASLFQRETDWHLRRPTPI